ncbi:MAG: 4-hydroxy-tetrahydrodipicolinate reductase [Chlamydiales bacterium]|nr:4-hydroxy-tetrahydrodipicolinate reductase [Chlamydiales bacterium]
MGLLIGVVGAAGKMGRTLLTCSLGDAGVKVAGGCTSAGSPHVGRDLGELIGAEAFGLKLQPSIEEIVEKAQVLIDFSLPDSTLKNARIAAKHKKPLVIGSTGHTREAKLEIESLAKEIPLLFSPNFSLGIALCLEACALFGRHLKESAYVDIIETHHTQKRDSPSGTALALAASLGFGQISTENTQPRSRDTVQIHSIRSGAVPGKHSVIFECQGERLEITHEVHSREAFAKGAIRAAKFLAGRPPGLYSLKDLILQPD